MDRAFISPATPAYAAINQGMEITNISSTDNSVSFSIVKLPDPVDSGNSVSCWDNGGAHFNGSFQLIWADPKTITYTIPGPFTQSTSTLDGQPFTSVASPALGATQQHFPWLDFSIIGQQGAKPFLASFSVQDVSGNSVSCMSDGK